MKRTWGEWVALKRHVSKLKRRSVDWLSHAMKARIGRVKRLSAAREYYRYITSFEGEGLHRIEGGPLRGRLIQVNPPRTREYLIGNYEVEMARAISRNLGEGMVSFDIGSHRGYFALLMAQLVGADGRCFAFEPHPRVWKRLQATVSVNSLGQLEAHNLALGDSDGQVDFAVGHYEMTGSLLIGGEAVSPLTVDSRIIVDSRRLDTFVDGQSVARVDLVKIDVEGAEESVLLGARATLRRFRPKLLIELHNRPDDPAHVVRIAKMLSQLGYQLFDLTGRRRLLPKAGFVGHVLAMQSEGRPL